MVKKKTSRIGFQPSPRLSGNACTPLRGVAVAAYSVPPRPAVGLSCAAAKTPTPR